jgi:1,4-dihydroxy-2-naphthoate octaprenyltransferase
MTLLGKLPDAALITILPAFASFKAGQILMDHAAEPGQLVAGIKLTILAASLHGLLLSLVLAFFN